MKHYHRCPLCYEAVRCDYPDCSIFYELRDKGHDFGGFCVCEACELREEIEARRRARP